MPKIRNLDESRPWQEQDLGGYRGGVCIVRYGAWGDSIQMSGILPLLKEQGYRVTVNTTDRGYLILRGNPYIDEFFLQKTDQVPNEELDEYWDALAKRFDRLVQLSESVEGALLALPGRPEFLMDKEERHRKMNVNYQERTHDLAGVPYEFGGARFYPSKREREWARKERKKMGHQNKVIVWTLSGSSVHKAWPYTDQVIARLLCRPKTKVVLVGDLLCKVLEFGWEKEPRVIRKSGKWSIRETLSFIEQADLLVGPETGVMNAAGQLSVPKVCILSHSTPENLTKHWRNVAPIEPINCPCYPCHKMHYGWFSCHRERRGMEVDGALCQVKISPDRVYGAIAAMLFNRCAA